MNKFKETIASMSKEELSTTLDRMVDEVIRLRRSNQRLLAMVDALRKLTADTIRELEAPHKDES